MSICPLCNSDAISIDISATNLPRYPVVKSGVALSQEHFSSLDLGWCSTCDHYFNLAVIDDVFLDSALPTNFAVSSQMAHRHDSLSRYLVDHVRSSGMALDIGSGTGGYTKALLNCGFRVIALEPLTDLEIESDRCEVVRDVWPSKALENMLFDVIICVQVLEHLKSPLTALEKIIDSLTPEGRAYVEVPSGDWVLTNSSAIDVHIPHSHYFTRSSIERAFSAVGAEVVDIRNILNGKDTGYLIRRKSNSLNTAPPAQFRPRHAGLRHTIELLKNHSLDERKCTAIYGANAGCQSLIGWLKDSPISVVLDDTPSYWGNDVYSIRGRLGITNPTLARVDEIERVIIASYNHDTHIFEKLQMLGFSGETLTLRPPKLATSKLPSLLSSL